MLAVLKKYFSPVVNQDEQLGFLQIFKPLYVTLAALGLFPRAVEFPDGKTNVIVVSKYSKINETCTLLMVSVIHGFFVLHLFELNLSSKDNSFTEDAFTLTTYTVSLVAQVFFCTVSYFYVIRDKTLYIKMLNEIAHCWDRLAKGNRRQILGKLRVQVNCVVLDSLWVIYLHLQIITYTDELIGAWKKTLLILTFTLPEIIQFAVIAFYFVMILLVEAVLKNIEEELTLILYKRNVGNNFVNADLGEAIAEIEDVYTKALEVKRQVNVAFQAPLLAALAMTFHELVGTLHRVYHGLSFQDNFSVHDILESITTVFHQLVKVYALARTGSLLKYQVNRIGRALHNIPNSGDQDLKVYLKVQHFSSLINFHDATITIYGFFPLDATLMFNDSRAGAAKTLILKKNSRIVRNMSPVVTFNMVLCRVGIRQGINVCHAPKPESFKSWSRPGCRYSTCPAGMKVTICGAAGCTGQPLAMLLKQCPLLDEIALYDTLATCGYGMELSHIDTKCKVSSYSGRHMLCDALADSKIVVIVVRNQCDSFENNAPAVSDIAIQICNVCPNAFIVVATEPVESMVPIVAEIQRLRSAYNPRKLLGCVELNCVRANTVLADFLRVPPESVRVPVVGGAAPQTMVPVLSQSVHPCLMSQEQVECVTSCIMNGTEAVCAAKGGCRETACLAGAYAIARTTVNVARGLQGQGGVVQCGYVDSLNTCAPCCQFFASEVILGASGVTKNLGVPELSKFEHCLLCNCLPYIRNEIARAIWLVYVMCSACCTPGCCVHPCTCFEPPAQPCVPPVNWTCDCPDACRDEYLASICRKHTCTDGSYELCWRPRPQDYDKARALSVQHLAPLKGCGCSSCKVPRSVRLVQDYLEKTKDPCCGRNV